MQNIQIIQEFVHMFFKKEDGKDRNHHGIYILLDIFFLML